jgi:hypothetical protein
MASLGELMNLKRGGAEEDVREEQPRLSKKERKALQAQERAEQESLATERATTETEQPNAATTETAETETLGDSNTGAEDIQQFSENTGSADSANDEQNSAVTETVGETASEQSGETLNGAAEPEANLLELGEVYANRGDAIEAENVLETEAPIGDTNLQTGSDSAENQSDAATFENTNQATTGQINEAPSNDGETASATSDYAQTENAPNSEVASSESNATSNSEDTATSTDSGEKTANG